MLKRNHRRRSPRNDTPRVERVATWSAARKHRSAVPPHRGQNTRRDRRGRRPRDPEATPPPRAVGPASGTASARLRVCDQWGLGTPATRPRCHPRRAEGTRSRRVAAARLGARRGHPQATAERSALCCSGSREDLGACCPPGAAPGLTSAPERTLRQGLRRRLRRPPSGQSRGSHREHRSEVPAPAPSPGRTPGPPSAASRRGVPPGS
jgi:hypothetical protein